MIESTVLSQVKTSTCITIFSHVYLFITRTIIRDWKKQKLDDWEYCAFAGENFQHVLQYFRMCISNKRNNVKAGQISFRFESESSFALW